VLSQDQFDAGDFEDTIAHEGSHAILEYHIAAGGKDLSKRIPDVLALRVADLFLRLKNTKRVPLPQGKFDQKTPPPLEGPGDRPAGLVMVYDTLWSGAGGHPWDVDEFFASAYGGFVQQPKVLKLIAEHYEKADPKLKPLVDEMFALLAKVSDPKAGRKLKTPAKGEEARAELADVSPPVDVSGKEDRLGWLITPGKMPSPDEIQCAASGSRRMPTTEELLEGATKGPKEKKER
jgi:hypothetical protein